MERSDIPFLSASELSRLIQKKEISPVEAVEAYLERIDRVDGKLNSYITLLREEALADARQAEEEIARGESRGPMHGVPVGVKDQFFTRGIRTTAGSTILADYVPDEDATVISNLKKAGAILLGKLNMSEFAAGDTIRHPYGIPHNPWDLTRYPGGSSTGSAAATSASLCATSLGEDTGGSIRGPACYCNLVGLRPSYGRVSRHGIVGAVWSMDTVGPISRTVEDCAMTLGAIAGYDPKDPYTWNTPVPDYVDELDGNISGVRVGVIKERVYVDGIEPDIKEGVVRAIAVLGELGASVEEVSLPLTVYSSFIFAPISFAELGVVHHRWIRERLRDYDSGFQKALQVDSIIPAQAYVKGQKLRAILREQVLDALRSVDVLVLPTSSIPAWEIPTSGEISSKEQVRALHFGRRSWTAPANLAGVPAISVPCGFTTDDPPLPFGLQIMGRPFEDGTVMKVAHAYEQSTEWHTMRPPV